MAILKRTLSLSVEEFVNTTSLSLITVMQEVFCCCSQLLKGSSNEVRLNLLEAVYISDPEVKQQHRHAELPA
ncbi:hypothetical protein DAPPUDRAFT_234770 [Daphnia pulex]|uniref:Uncharacterized protein n=1 Tax=Daphnia pulex TaxID=6669 RepID=E9FXC9_DAPPU|nr:hypothetical protein DAPPUDRAFT_234770 [Daphnia pulex]|eukprot:EFX88291.1 hypothetical protein DAPPUDRAFT_234770 [Daphnia pulex]